MNNKSLKAFCYTALILILISVFLLDGGHAFIVLFITLLYVLISNIIIRYRDKLSDIFLGILVALLCASSVLVWYLLMFIFSPLKF